MVSDCLGETTIIAVQETEDQRGRVCTRMQEVYTPGIQSRQTGIGLRVPYGVFRENRKNMRYFVN